MPGLYAVRATLLACGLCLAAWLPAVAAAFGEEHDSALDSDERVSTHHLYLTRALAVCAGLPGNGKADPFDQPALAERVAIADQLSDSETLSHAQGSSTLCRAAPYAMPQPAQLGCPAEGGTRVIVPVTGVAQISGWLPVPKWDPSAGCFASRFGPYSNDFHFPDAARLAVLRDWALGRATTLPGTARFSFGGYFGTPWSADCHAQRNEVTDTGNVRAGSPEALGLYLHALADAHSHALCLANWGARNNPPWATHTLLPEQTGCGFTDHMRELGCPGHRKHDNPLSPVPDARYTQQSLQAGIVVYDALRDYARQQGLAPRLPDTPAGRSWLARHVERYVGGWAWLPGADERRDFANALAEACAGAPAASVPMDVPRTAREAVCSLPQGSR